MRPNFNITEVENFIKNQGPKTKIYIGCDSSLYRKNNVFYTDYVSVVVVHKDAKHGCKIFGKIETELDYSKKLNLPRLRLMNEVYKATNLYQELIFAIGDKECEIHLDINSDEKYSSSVVLKEAIGYVKGVTGIEPKIKPDAFASSNAADRFMRMEDITKPKRIPYHML